MKKVLVLDFGGQYNLLVARRVRECGVYCEIRSWRESMENIRAFQPDALIFTGGPATVFEPNAPMVDPALFSMGIPVLGICYGQQLMIHLLGGQCRRRNWTLIVPEQYGHCSEHALVMISSALSGGSLRQRLQEAQERFGRDRVALALQRVAEDFFLPSPSGSGTPLSQDELHRRIHQLSPSIFFSQELCARYFTYMSRESGAHFVLFDDGATLRRKLEAAQSLDIRTVLAPWPEIADVTVALGLYPAERTRTGQVLR